MTEPRRVRLGGDLFHPRPPAGAVNVTRQARKPHRKYANPHRVGKPCGACGGAVHDQAEAVALYRRHLAEHPDLVDAARRELAGRDLACWCPLDRPCHAGVLLEVANQAAAP